MNDRHWTREESKRACIKLWIGACLGALSVSSPNAPALANSIITSSYYEDSPGERSCKGFECSITFAKVPNGKQVTIDGVACGVSVTGGALQAATLLQKVGASFSIGRGQPLSFHLESGGTTKTYLISTTSRMRFVQGARPAIQLISNSDGASVGVVCQISGSVNSSGSQSVAPVFYGGPASAWLYVAAVSISSRAEWSGRAWPR